MKVNECMVHQVHVTRPDMTLREAAKIMDDMNVGALPVCRDDKLVGIVTDRDIVIRAISAGQDPNVTFVRDAMTSPILYCLDDQDTSETRQLMFRKQVRRLPVLNRQRRMVGIISLADLQEEPSERYEPRAA